MCTSELGDTPLQSFKGTNMRDRYLKQFHPNWAIYLSIVFRTYTKSIYILYYAKSLLIEFIAVNRYILFIITSIKSMLSNYKTELQMINNFKFYVDK